jgi:protein SCO1
MRITERIGLLAALFSMLSACGPDGGGSTSENPVAAPLPFFGEHDVEMKHGKDGELIPDTIYYRLPYFSFLNQDSVMVSHKTYEDRIFVADFFFTNCESICPIMSSQMVRIQELLKKEGLSDRVWLLSHTVDPVRDTPQVLKEYAGRIGADLSTWNFVTGSAGDIYWQAETGYMLSAFPSDTAQGGFFHTDRFTLLDRSMRIRGYYDGTSTKEVDKLLNDIKRLVQDEYPGE